MGILYREVMGELGKSLDTINMVKVNQGNSADEAGGKSIETIGSMNINSLFPVLINIVPASNLQFMLGLHETTDSKKLGV